MRYQYTATIASAYTAVSGLEEGLDFADVLHHASYRSCESVASFDERKFARRTNKLEMMPRVFVPA